MTWWSDCTYFVGAGNILHKKFVTEANPYKNCWEIIDQQVSL